MSTAAEETNDSWNTLSKALARLGVTKIPKKVRRRKRHIYTKPHCNNALGITGVCRIEGRTGTRYKAVVKFNGISIHLGSYATVEEATAARVGVNKLFTFLHKKEF